jgi:DNA recombination protein RmuC
VPKLESSLKEDFRINREESNRIAKDNREELANTFKRFSEGFDQNIRSFNDQLREKFGLLEIRQAELVKNTEAKLESIRVTVEEKLEKTLSDRLGQSFETVGKQLIEVQKGLGEMQTIASDVGGLKKVLSNVKLRGGVGEVQLALLLEQMLAPNQYDANVRTKKGSSDPVEFAIKLPGRSEDETAFVYLPIDAKFPKDAYEHLIAAYENAIPDDIELATKNMETTIRKMAKDIRDKYLDPPNTTDFAIMFLPFESIYAEVIRRSALVDQLRDEYKITIAGPTTLMAILNSLQMGFRTLALQKRSSEVWGVLSTVKTEFEKFGGLLEKAQKNIQAGLGQLDDVVGTRTRAIQRQLRDVESLPAVEVKSMLPEGLAEEVTIPGEAN